MTRVILIAVVALLLGAPVVVIGDALWSAQASAAGTPTPDPSPTPASGASSIGVTIGGGPIAISGGSGSNTGHGRGSGEGSASSGSAIPAKPAVPAEPTTTSNRLVLNHLSFRPGETLIATGTRFTPGEKVQFVLYPGATEVKSFVANPSGEVKATFVLSSRTSGGSHTIEATGWQSHLVASADYSVVSSSSASIWSGANWIVWVIGCLAIAGAIVMASGLALGWFPVRLPALVRGGRAS